AVGGIVAADGGIVAAPRPPARLRSARPSGVTAGTGDTPLAGARDSFGTGSADPDFKNLVRHDRFPACPLQPHARASLSRRLSPRTAALAACLVWAASGILLAQAPPPQTLDAGR